MSIIPCYGRRLGISWVRICWIEPKINDSEDCNLWIIKNSKQFGSPLSEKALDQAMSDHIHTKTWMAVQWAVSVFHASCDACGVKDATEKMAIEVLADLLPRFIMEAKSQDEILYPPPPWASKWLERTELGKLVKEMCDRGGFYGHYTNHPRRWLCYWTVCMLIMWMSNLYCILNIYCPNCQLR